MTLFTAKFYKVKSDERLNGCEDQHASQDMHSMHLRPCRRQHSTVQRSNVSEPGATRNGAPGFVVPSLDLSRQVLGCRKQASLHLLQPDT